MINVQQYICATIKCVRWTKQFQKHLKNSLKSVVINFFVLEVLKSKEAKKNHENFTTLIFHYLLHILHHFLIYYYRAISVANASKTTTI